MSPLKLILRLINMIDCDFVSDTHCKGFVYQALKKVIINMTSEVSREPRKAVRIDKEMV